MTKTNATTNLTVTAARERALRMCRTAHELNTRQDGFATPNECLRTLAAAVQTVDPERHIDHLPDGECITMDLAHGVNGSVEVYLQYSNDDDPDALRPEVLLYLPGCGQYIADGDARPRTMRRAVLLAYMLGMQRYDMLLEYGCHGLPTHDKVRAWYDERRSLAGIADAPAPADTPITPATPTRFSDEQLLAWQREQTPSREDWLAAMRRVRDWYGVAQAWADPTEGLRLETERGSRVYITPVIAPLSFNRHDAKRVTFLLTVYGDADHRDHITEHARMRLLETAVAKAHYLIAADVL